MMPRYLAVLVSFVWFPAVICAQSSLGSPLGGLDRLREGRTCRASSADPNWQNGNADARGIAPGQTRTVAELEGPGRIQHIWFTIAASDPYYGRSVTLRAYWDGAKEPAVESPLGDFFAQGHGIRVPVNSVPVQVSSDGRAYNCYWPMPFRESARITVSNDSTTHTVHALYWYVDWQKLPSLPADTAYFHAQYRQEFPCVSGDYLILDAVGRGHYVGTVLSVHMNDPGWFGEGDDRFYIDGEKEPSLRGTGTEDYFCDAWGFRQFNNPFYGVSIWEGFDLDDHATAYRWHLTDPACFQKSLRVTIEHKGAAFDRDGKLVSGFGERPDHFSSVAFWYQVGPAKRFASLPPAAERVAVGQVIEAESLLEQVEATPSKTVEAQDGGYSQGKQLFYHPVPSDAAPVLKVPFEVAEDGRHVVKVRLTHSWDYGTFRIDLDGQTVVPAVDLYASEIRVERVKIGVHELKKGRHTLTFTYLRSNPESEVRGSGETGRYLGVDRIELRRLAPRQ